MGKNIRQDPARDEATRSASANTRGNKANALDAAQGDGVNAPLRFNKVAEGIVVAADNGANTVTVDVGGRTVTDVVWTTAVVARFLGFKMHTPPTRGTKVLIAFSSPPFVLRTLPSDRPDRRSGKSRDMLYSDKVGRGPLDPTPSYGPHGAASVPRDLLEGEIDLENHLGVGLRLLHLLCSLNGGERAKVEACVLNDMVRIVSDTFKHFSAFGDMQIYNDGRLNVRFDGTSYQHEAWGLASPADLKATEKGGTVESEEDVVRNGRNRFSQFVGFLGDFVHQFVTEPASALTSIAEDAFRPGKSRLQCMSDGTILLQSITEIALERVVRVQVPVEKKRWDDPSGNVIADFKSLEQSYLKIWDFGGQEARTIHHTAYQLREYARWLSCYHGYARFHQLSADWAVPDEEEDGEGAKTVPSWKNQEADVAAANTGSSDTVDTYATIRIMRDGSTLTYDGYGNAIVTGKSGVQISSTERIQISSAGDLELEAGGDILLKARRNVEITAVNGGLILKARAWWKALCERGRLWLKSDAQDPEVEAEAPEEANLDYPAYEQGDYAVVIEASRGKMYLGSERTMMLSANGRGDTEEEPDQADITASVIIQSRFQDVRIQGARNVTLNSMGVRDGNLGLEAQSGAILALSPKFFSSARLFDIRPFTGGDYPAIVSIENGRISAVKVAAKFIGATDRLAGPPRRPQPDPDIEVYLSPMAPHLNHVSLVEDFDAPDFEADIGTRLTYEEDVNLGYINPYAESSLIPSWAYPDAGDYVWAAQGDPVERPRMEFISQDHMAADDTFAARVDTWDFAGDALLPAPGTAAGSRPYPGQAARELYYPPEAGQLLQGLLEGAYNEQNTATPLKSRAPTRKFRKRAEL